MASSKINDGEDIKQPRIRASMRLMGLGVPPIVTPAASHSGALLAAAASQSMGAFQDVKSVAHQTASRPKPSAAGVENIPSTFKASTASTSALKTIVTPVGRANVLFDTQVCWERNDLSSADTLSLSDEVYMSTPVWVRYTVANSVARVVSSTSTNLPCIAAPNLACNAVANAATNLASGAVASAAANSSTNAAANSSTNTAANSSTNTAADSSTNTAANSSINATANSSTNTAANSIVNPAATPTAPQTRCPVAQIVSPYPDTLTVLDAVDTAVHTIEHSMTVWIHGPCDFLDFFPLDVIQDSAVRTALAPDIVPLSTTIVSGQESPDVQSPVRHVSVAIRNLPVQSPLLSPDKYTCMLTEILKPRDQVYARVGIHKTMFPHAPVATFFICAHMAAARSGFARSSSRRNKTSRSPSPSRSTSPPMGRVTINNNVAHSAASAHFSK